MESQVEKTVKNEEEESDIDLEWLELLLEAKRMGLTVNEVRDFFQVNKVSGS